MDTPKHTIDGLSREINSIRECFDETLEDVERTISGIGDEAARLSGESQESTHAIRAIVRRFERKLDRMNDRVSKLESRQ